MEAEVAEKLCVVVVDNERPILNLVCDVLTNAGMTAVECAHGVGAIACIRQTQPNLVILDLEMPVVDGVEVFQSMRAEPQTAHTPVLFLTANAHLLHERLPTYPAQGAAVLSKPFKILTLVAMVKQMVKSV